MVEQPALAHQLDVASRVIGIVPAEGVAIVGLEQNVLPVPDEVVQHHTVFVAAPLAAAVIGCGRPAARRELDRSQVVLDVPRIRRQRTGRVDDRGVAVGIIAVRAVLTWNRSGLRPVPQARTPRTRPRHP